MSITFDIIIDYNRLYILQINRHKFEPDISKRTFNRQISISKYLSFMINMIINMIMVIYNE